MRNNSLQLTLKATKAGLLLGSCCLLLWACKSKTADPSNQNVGYGFFPLETGRFWVYKVDERTIRFNQPVETKGYLVKELVGDTFVTNQGEVAYKLFRFKYFDTARVQNYASLNWQPDSLWSVRRGANIAVRTENNVPILKLIFPMREGSLWNANQYNQFGAENPLNYRVREFGRQIVVDGKTYARSLRVQQANDFSCLGQDVKSEYYAEGIGLVYKVSQVSAFNPDSCSGRIIQGRYLVQTLLTTGLER